MVLNAVYYGANKVEEGHSIDRLPKTVAGLSNRRRRHHHHQVHPLARLASVGLQA